MITFLVPPPILNHASPFSKEINLSKILSLLDELLRCIPLLRFFAVRILVNLQFVALLIVIPQPLFEIACRFEKIFHDHVITIPLILEPELLYVIILSATAPFTQKFAPNCKIFGLS